MTNIIDFETGMSNRLTVIASELHKAHVGQTMAREEWIKQTINVARLMREAREHFPCDRDFSHWLVDNEIEYGKDDRAAYIKLGAETEERLWFVLTQSKGMSVQLIGRDLPDDWGMVRSVTNHEEICATIVETVETVSITEEIVETSGENNDESEKPKAKAVIVKPVKRIDPFTVIRGFMRAKSHIARAALEKIADAKGGKQAIEAFAEALSTGKYGDGYDVNVSHLGPRAIFPDLPETWSKRHNFIKNSVFELRTLTANLDNLLTMKMALEAENPVKNRVSKFCDEWWFNNVQNKSVGKRQVGDDYNPLDATAAAFAAKGIVMPSIADHGPYSECRAEDRYIPIRDSVDIIVCGVTIYKAGSEPWEKFCKIAGAYEAWRMLEAGYKLHEPRIVERGFEYRRLRGPFAWGDPVFAQVIWNIGNAMANHPDKFAETSGTHVRGAGG